ncbi:MAG: SPOR domain-containing protein [Alphaproteobacteria bacterium]|nr:SPOR domain-containing protein [Alphaproteobacteria bacterium]
MPLEGSIASRAPRTLGAVDAASVEPSLTDDIPAAEPRLRRRGRAAGADDGGPWGVQLGAFANAGNGQRYAAALRARGVAAEAVSGAGLGRPDMTVVVAGRYAVRGGADAAAATLRRQLGTPVLVVRR